MPVLCCLFIFVLPLKIHYEKENGLINRFSPAAFMSLSHARSWFSFCICRGLLYVRWCEVRGDCTFCWYWWNCWQSLFKLSFHKSMHMQYSYIKKDHCQYGDGKKRWEKTLFSLLVFSFFVCLEYALSWLLSCKNRTSLIKIHHTFIGKHVIWPMVVAILNFQYGIIRIERILML